VKLGSGFLTSGVDPCQWLNAMVVRMSVIGGGGCDLAILDGID
jgi:hypothetical protein